MKKVMVFAFSFLMITGASVFAQDVVKSTKDTTVTTTPIVDPVKTEIKTSELPQPVKDLIVSFKSQGWDAAETSYVAKDSANQVIFYVVSFKNPTSGESKSINIDKDGKIVNQ